MTADVTGMQKTHVFTAFELSYDCSAKEHCDLWKVIDACNAAMIALHIALHYNLFFLVHEL